MRRWKDDGSDTSDGSDKRQDARREDAAQLFDNFRWLRDGAVARRAERRTRWRRLVGPCKIIDLHARRPR